MPVARTWCLLMSGMGLEVAVLAAGAALASALLVARWIWERLAPPVPPRAARVYISWARAGRTARDRLVHALKPAIDAGRLVVHHDREVRRGHAWDQQLHPRVHDADLYLVLLTPDWLRDPLCRGRERSIWEPRVERGRARVLLVLLHATDLREPALSRLPLYPPDGRPLGRPGRELSEPAAEALLPVVLAAAGRS